MSSKWYIRRILDDIKKFIPEFIQEFITKFVPEFVPEFDRSTDFYSGTNSELFEYNKCLNLYIYVTLKSI